MSFAQLGTDFILSPYLELSYSSYDRIKSVPYGSISKIKKALTIEIDSQGFGDRFEICPL